MRLGLLCQTAWFITHARPFANRLVGFSNGYPLSPTGSQLGAKTLPYTSSASMIPAMGDYLFWQGFLFGLAIAAPVGPIGVLTIRRTLVDGLLVGLLSGLGAATADALYGSVAALGLTAVAGFLVQQQFWLRLGGGLFLAYLGLKTLRQPSALPQATSQNPPAESSYLSAYASTLLLTLTNPVTILSFTAVFAGFWLGSQHHSLTTGGQLVLGVFLGSALWWLFLCGVVTAVRSRLPAGVFRLINALSGLILLGFALLLLLNIFI